MNRCVSNVFCFCWIFLTTSALGQDCNKSFQDANQAYYNGNFEQALQLLKSCEELKDKDQEHILLLLVNASLMSAQKENAAIHMERLLTLNPSFQSKPYYSLEFQKLFSSFSLTTTGSIGLATGISIPQIEPLRNQSYAAITSEQNEYNTFVNASYGISGTYRLWKFAFLSSGLYFQQNTFEQSETILNYQQIRSKEVLSYFRIPVQLELQPFQGTIRPFLAFGPSFQSIVTSKVDLDRFPIPTEIPIPFSGIPFSTEGYNVSDQRKSFLINWSFSTGAYVNKGTYLFGLRLSYDRGLRNIVDEANRYTNSELLDVFAYVPDDLIVNNFSILLSAQKTFTIPTKTAQ